MVYRGNQPDPDDEVLPQPSARRAADFFVAGGPLSPDRACYIPRSADEALYTHLRDGDYCHVIAPRFSGKSSLLARTAHRIRAEGGLASIVDLSQLGSRDGSTEVGRWYYGLAYRVLRDLRLKVDLQGWWQDRLALPPAQRLSEFFWEIVLGGTRAPVTVFLDEIDSVEQLDYATELFGIVRACHDARAGEPEYQRLTFALFGAALPAGAAERAGVSAIEVSVRLELPDFRFEEARPLAAGMGLPPGDAERALYRVMYWTGGHPYLTQKLCQSVARNAARIDSDEAIDRLVAARFFARNASAGEASISRVLDSLDRADKLARPALRLYRRVRRGWKVRYQPENPTHELLRVSGLVTVTAGRHLVVRNRIYAEVFSHRWAREQLPVEWGRLGRIAGLAALFIGAVWGYAEILPRPYEETLRVVSVELEEADAAWRGLRRLPGYGGRADRLLARVLIRQSRLAATWPEVAALDERLRSLPGFHARADALLVEYWERRAAIAEAAERRDEALLYRLRAYEAGPTADAARAAELTGADYSRLRTVIRPAGLIEALAPAENGRTIVTLSGGNVLERWDADSGLPLEGAPLELLAEEFVTVRRRLSLEAPGRVGQVSVSVRIEHPRPGDLQLRLVSPAGRSAELPLASARPAGDTLLFDEAGVPALRALRGEQASGSWQLEITDRAGGPAGFFGGWALRVSPAAGHRAEERPENPLLLPTPTQTSTVRGVLSRHGGTVAVMPRNPEARGRLQALDTVTGALRVAVDVAYGERWLGFSDEDTLLLVEHADGVPVLRVLDLEAGRSRFTQRAGGRFVSGPGVSPDGAFVGMAEAGPNMAWVRELRTGREVFRQATAGEAAAIAVAPGGLMLAVADPGDVVRVWHTTDRALLGEFHQAGTVATLGFDPTGRWLAVTGLDGALAVWDLAAPGSVPILARPGGGPRQVAFDASGRLLLTLDATGDYEAWRLADGLPYGAILRHGERPVALPDRSSLPRPMLANDQLLVGGRGTRSARVWSMSEAGAPTELPRSASRVAIGPSGLRMAAGLADGRVILRLRDPDVLRFHQAIVTGGEARHGGAVTALAFSPDGTRLVSVAADGSVLLWDALSGRLAAPLFQHGSGRVASVDLGPEGRLLVTAGELGARAWDAGSGAPGVMLGPGRSVSAVVLDATGGRAFIGTQAGEIESWDIASGERLWFSALQGPVTQIAVGPDGGRVAAADDAGRVQVWGMSSGGRPQGLTLAAPVVGLQFSPDGRSLLAQTSGWLHRLEASESGLRVASSRMLPGAVPPGAWRSAEPDGRRVVLLAGALSETMAVLDLERPPMPADSWQPDLAGWQARLKLYFGEDGELHPGAPPAPPPAEGVAGADREGDNEFAGM